MKQLNLLRFCSLALVASMALSGMTSVARAEDPVAVEIGAAAVAQKDVGGAAQSGGKFTLRLSGAESTRPNAANSWQLSGAVGGVGGRLVGGFDSKIPLTDRVYVSVLPVDASFSSASVDLYRVGMRLPVKNGSISVEPILAPAGMSGVVVDRDHTQTHFLKAFGAQVGLENAVTDWLYVKAALEADVSFPGGSDKKSSWVYLKAKVTGEIPLVRAEQLRISLGVGAVYEGWRKVQDDHDGEGLASRGNVTVSAGAYGAF